MIQLTKSQLKRLYNVFDFTENEEIVTATIDSEYGGTMVVTYVDSENAIGNYVTYFMKHSQEDVDKLNYILLGKELN